MNLPGQDGAEIFGLIGGAARMNPTAVSAHGMTIVLFLS
jgi:hypothetical protein